MRWQKRIVSKELISYEKVNKGLRIVIEARSSGEGKWEIFKIYSHNEKNYVEEHNAQSKSEADKIITQLKKEKDLSQKQVETLASVKKQINVRIKREYKCDIVEKWSFRVNGGEYENFFVIYHDMDAVIDIVMNEEYRPMEKEIIAEIGESLNFDMLEGEMIQKIFYFKEKREYQSSPFEKKGVVLGQVMFDYQEEE